MVDRWLANDWVLRVLSLLIAIGIWAEVTHLGQNPTVVRKPVVRKTVVRKTVVRNFTGLPVTVRNTGSLRVQVAPQSVSVQVRGPAAIVDALQPGAIHVSASVPYAVPGLYLTTIQVTTSVGGTEVVAVMPDQASVTLYPASSSP